MRLQGLIRYAKWQADELRRELADLESLRADFLNQLSNLSEELRRETEAASDPVLGRHFAAYADAVREKQTILNQSVREVESSIDGKRDELSEAFQEQKRFEILHARKKAAAELEENRQEQSRLDEVALNQHQRKSAIRA